MTQEYQYLSEYIIKLDGALNKELLASLTRTFEAGRDIAEHIQEVDLIALAEIQSSHYQNYSTDVMPNIVFNDEGNKYSLELDAIEYNTDEKRLCDLGGKGRSQRFVAFMFIVGSGESAEFRFPSQNVINNCKSGDALIFPPYFSHRFAVSPLGTGSVKTINLYCCMQYQ
ncbi:hypothetical protein [Alteromonas sp. ASW11-130]|uniref:hypothetical protein n=1 Tax=Alteromonas sp. ASW11-130 TaxID=3015775 RepID=UPI002241F7CB|nr:hypothetical protein [Alteromonas sp. ASW11-130]MCW8092484.1 hypothetical protein [Alteromonas sp. ASW11-130]